MVQYMSVDSTSKIVSSYHRLFDVKSKPYNMVSLDLRKEWNVLENLNLKPKNIQVIFGHSLESTTSYQNV